MYANTLKFVGGCLQRAGCFLYALGLESTQGDSLLHNSNTDSLFTKDGKLQLLPL